MPQQHHIIHELSRTVADEKDLISDAVGLLPAISSRAAPAIRDRFLHRLSKLTASTINMVEHESQSFVELRLQRNSGVPQVPVEEDKDLQTFLRRMANSMAIISKHRSGYISKEAEDSLRDSILLYAYGNVKHIPEGIKRIFANYQARFDDFITKMFGIHETELDQEYVEIGSRILTLYQVTNCYDKSVGQLYNLINITSAMVETFPSLQKGIASALGGGRFSDKLFQLICTLAFPKRAHDTFVLVARTSTSFRRIKIGVKSNLASLPEASLSRASSTAATTPPKRTMKSLATRSSTHTKFTSVSAQMSSAAMSAKVSGVPPQENPSEKPSIQTKIDILTAILPYLAEEDRVLGLARLQPASKQDAARLAGAVMRRQLLPLSTNAWYTFGFVTTRTEYEERQLARLYANILQAANDSNPISLFSELIEAVETHKLVQLFDRKGYAHFRQSFPRLEHFLNAPLEQRSTVWRLTHFIRDENNTEPPACLQRDYGFKYCQQREEVAKLKGYYAAILKKVDQLDLHNACVRGQLYEFGKQNDISIDLKDRRLMQNDYPAQCVGFESQSGLGAYSRQFYRRRL